MILPAPWTPVNVLPSAHLKHMNWPVSHSSESHICLTFSIFPVHPTWQNHAERSHPTGTLSFDVILSAGLAFASLFCFISAPYICFSIASAFSGPKEIPVWSVKRDGKFPAGGTALEVLQLLGQILGAILPLAHFSLLPAHGTLCHGVQNH